MEKTVCSLEITFGIHSSLLFGLSSFGGNGRITLLDCGTVINGESQG